MNLKVKEAIPERLFNSADPFIRWNGNKGSISSPYLFPVLIIELGKWTRKGRVPLSKTLCVFQ